MRYSIFVCIQLSAEKLNLSQQTVSKIEQKEIIEEEVLKNVAEALSISVDAIKNFKEEIALNVISNSFTSTDTSTLNAINYGCTFNPMDKIVELYERMLKAEQERVALLEEMLKHK